jgi:hypothetical protein
MYKIRMSIARLLFRMASWIQPEDIFRIEKVEGTTITIGDATATISDGAAFAAGDEIVVSRPLSS